MRQLPLDLAFPPRLGRDDFLAAGANAAALAMIDRWPDWPTPLCLLCGPHGAGKSHLAAIWAERSAATVLGEVALARPDWPDRLSRSLLIEDADRLDVPEAVLFHLLNLVRETGADLLITAASPPGRWGLRTADLLSRLRLATLVTLEPPDDALVRAVLVKLFADHQLSVDESVVGYLALRLARSLGDARTVVEALDEAALALNRRITRPMAAQVLAALSLDGEGA